MAVGNQRLLRDDLAQDIVALCNLMRQASLLPSAAKRITDTLEEVPKSKATLTVLFVTGGTRTPQADGALLNAASSRKRQIAALRAPPRRPSRQR